MFPKVLEVNPALLGVCDTKGGLFSAAGLATVPSAPGLRLQPLGRQTVHKGLAVMKPKRPRAAEGEGVKSRTFCLFRAGRNHLGLLRYELNLPVTVLRRRLSGRTVYPHTAPSPPAE